MDRELLLNIFKAALAAVAPYRAVLETLRREDGGSSPGDVYRLDAFERIVVVGAGKAAARWGGRSWSLVRKACDISVQPETYLGNYDSYTFFARVDSRTREKHHVLTGPIGTNVMDLQIILVEG